MSFLSKKNSPEQRAKQLLQECQEIISAIEHSQQLSLKDMIKLCNRHPESLMPFFKSRIQAFLRASTNYQQLAGYLDKAQVYNIKRLILFRLDELAKNNGHINLSQNKKEKIEAVRKEVSYK